MMSSFQIELYSQTNGLPEDNLQYTESGIGLQGIGIARIDCNWTESSSGWRRATSHSLLLVMK